MKKIFVIFFMFFFFFVFKLSCVAEKINITSDKMEVYEDKKVIIFTGNVEATQRDVKIWADKLYVYYNATKEGKKEVNKIVGIGNVKIIKGKVWKAFSGKAEYLKKEDKLILEDNPKIWYGEDLVEGDVVIIYFNQGKSEVLSKGDGRVKAYVYSK